MINKCPTARKLTAETGIGPRLQYFAGANALIADLRVNAREKSVSLLVAAVVVIEAARSGPAQRIAEDFFVPWLLDLGRVHSHLSIILQQLYTNINAFVTDISRMALKKARDFAIGETAERAAQDFSLPL
jgi:hypothetical protein